MFNCRYYHRRLKAADVMAPGFSQVIQGQRDQFRSGATVPIPARKERLMALRKLITENTDELCDAVYKDLRRLPTATNMLDIGSAIQEIDYMIANIEEWSKPEYVDRTLTNALDQTLLIKEPLGVVLIISQWNYPVSTILLPMISAIAAGNTIIIKPSEMSANVAATFEKLVAQYFEADYCTVVNGAVAETTELLEERFDHILYTGCPPVAKIIMAAAAKHLTPVTRELAGKCPVVVEDDCDIDIAARRIAWGKWLNCGQTCLAPDYILCTETVKTKLANSFTKYITEFYGNDIHGSKDYSRIINLRHIDRISALLDATEGAVLFKGGDRDRDDLFIPPTILDVKKTDLFMEDEIFGPLLPILTVRDLSEAIEYINQGEKPLAAYIFTSNERKAKRLVTETSSGGVTINDVVMHITVDTLPFGGVGNSGMGRDRGKYGFDTFAHEKAALKRGFFGGSLQASRYPRFMNFFCLPLMLRSEIWRAIMEDKKPIECTGRSRKRSAAVRELTPAPTGPPAKLPRTIKQEPEELEENSDGDEEADRRPISPFSDIPAVERMIVIRCEPVDIGSRFFANFLAEIPIHEGTRYALTIRNETQEDFEVTTDGDGLNDRWLSQAGSSRIRMLIDGYNGLTRFITVSITNNPNEYRMTL